MPRRLKVLLAAISCVLAIGTTGFVWIENYPPLDAFYMTLTTITTVGYGEIHPLSRRGRLFNCFLIFFGIGIMFQLIAAVAQAFIEREFATVFDAQKKKRMIDQLKDHFIVCGFGRVGRGAALEMQRAGVPFVICDRNEDRVERARKAGMLAVAADATRDESLRDLQVGRARGLVAALASDADNMFLILSAKTLNPALITAARAGEEEAEQKLKRAGADTVFAPYYLTGHRLAQSLLKPHVQEFLDIFTRDIGLHASVEQVRVTSGSEFQGKSLKEIQVRRELGVIVLAIRRDDGTMHFNPPADAILHSGDCLIVMGETDNLRRLETLLIGARK